MEREKPRSTTDHPTQQAPVSRDPTQQAPVSKEPTPQSPLSSATVKKRPTLRSAPKLRRTGVYYPSSQFTVHRKKKNNE